MNIFDYVLATKKLKSNLFTVQKFVNNRFLQTFLTSDIGYVKQEVEILLLERKILLLSSLISDLQFNLHRLRYCKMAKGGDGSPLIIACANQYLVSTDFQFDVHSYRNFLQKKLTELSLNYSDLDLALSAIQYSCFISLERLLHAKLISGEEQNDINVIQLIIILEETCRCSNSEIIKTVCDVEALLHKDPSGEYELMDQHSKDCYRSSLYKLANECRQSPADILKVILSRCFESNNQFPDSHVGHYLLSSGRKGVFDQYIKKNKRFDISSILKSISLYRQFLLLVAIVATGCMYWFVFSAAPEYIFILFAILILMIDAIDDGISVIATHFRPKRVFLSRDIRFLDSLSDNVLVAVPCIIDGRDRINRIFETVEENAKKANYDNVQFAIVSDWPDSDNCDPNNAERKLLEFCFEKIELLNRKFESEDNSKFILLHRKRVYSQAQKAWYGWERKQGKIQQLLSLMNGGQSNFEFFCGNYTSFKNAKFLIVLDEDTGISKDTIRRLVSAMSHPLNYNTVQEGKNYVVQGYGLAVPSLFIDPKSVGVWSARKFLLTRPIYNEKFYKSILPGSRNYLFDSFSESAFTGKGIYNPRTANNMLRDKLPSEKILSHDIVEGGIIRTGFVSEASIVENFPLTYLSYVRRMHRWIRGDWQNWLVFRNPAYQGITSPITKYLIGINIRKSLLFPALFSLFVFYFFAPEAYKNYILCSALIFPLVPAYISIACETLSDSIKGVFWLRLVSSIKYFIFIHMKQIVKLYLLPHFFLVSIHAMTISIWRIWRERNTLNWISSGSAGELPPSLFLKPSLINLLASLCVFLSVFLGCHELLVAICWIPFSIATKKLY